MATKKTRPTITCIALAVLGALGPSDRAFALGFGDIRAAALLGQPLNLAVPVTLGEGETLTSDCVAAEVQSGDSRLPPGTVRARITQGREPTEAILRVTTTVAIDEPVVNVTVSAGCPPRITRSLVLLADPPLVTATAPTTSPSPATTAPVAGGQETTNPVPAAATEPSASTEPAVRATRPATPSRATRTATAPRPPARATADAGAAQAQQAPSSSSRRRATAAPTTPRPATAESRPRLQLDGGQVATGPASPSGAASTPGTPAAPAAAPSPAVAAAEEQASAARAAVIAAEAAASAATQRMKDMEAEVARLRSDAKAQTDALVELRKQIAQDRSRGEPSWLMTLLLGVAGALGVLAVWLAMRLRDQQKIRANQRDAWYERAAPASSIGPAADSRREDEDENSDYSGQMSRIPSTLPPPVPPAPKAQLSPPSMFDTRAGGLDSMISPPTMPAHTSVTLPISSSRTDQDDSLRAVSVDEQIDLEQQADFFIALGHDESAIDLLMAHLRSTGGSTPLPFLKLLEIHRRRGDRDAYERTRVRFNQRFNSVAPDWQADPKSGRSLEDYPLAVGRIQAAWATPLDSMAELEALLFRRGQGSEMFDLPAYQEVLFLYQLARDLHQQSQPDAANTDVDVLLPIMTAPAPLADGAISLKPEFNSGQTMTLDLDLEGRPPSEDKPMLELDLGEATPPADGKKPA